MKERYTIQLTGEILGKTDREAVITRLSSMFKCDSARIAQFFDGERKSLKTGMDWKTALKYRKAIERQGAGCELKVVMDCKSFEASIFDRESIHVRKALASAPFQFSDTGKKEAPGQVVESSSRKSYYFDRARIIPLIFSPSAREPVLEGEDAPVGEISSFKPAVSYTAALFLTVGVTFFLEWYFLTYFTEYVSTGRIATLLAILLFFLVIVFLPNFLRPLRRLSIELKQTEGEISMQLLQERTLFNLSKKFVVETPEGRRIAQMYKSPIRNRSLCFDRTGNILFSAQEESDIDELFLDAAGEIRDELMNFEMINLIRYIGEKISDAISIIKGVKKTKSKTIASLVQNIDISTNRKMFVLRDTHGKAIGQVFTGRRTRFIFYTKEIRSIDIRGLFCFCLMVAGL